MSKYIIDAYAWIEYLDGTSAGRKVSTLFEGDNEMYCCALTVAEVVSKVARKNQNAQTAYDILLSNAQIVTIDEELSMQAGLIHCEMRKTQKDFGLADAYILALAKMLKAKILTSDAHFENVKEAIMIK
jgi:uncharacterized protein